MSGIEKINIYLLQKKFFINRGAIDLSDNIESFTLSGINFKLKGRLKGVKRARKIQMAKGKIKAQSLSFPVQAKCQAVQTK